MIEHVPYAVTTAALYLFGSGCWYFSALEDEEHGGDFWAIWAGRIYLPGRRLWALLSGDDR